MKTKNNHKTAFTLAEVLMSLAIIGVIAAITIPPLKDYSDEQTIISQVNKSFSDISGATSNLETKYGNSQFWDWSDTAVIAERYSETMQTRIKKGNSFTTMDGATWTFLNGKTDTSDQFSDGGEAIVDLNGAENSPNKNGIDIFAYRITKNGVVPYGNENYKKDEYNDTYTVIQEHKVPAFKMK